MKEVMQDWDIPRIQNVLSDEFSGSFQRKWSIPRATRQNGGVEIRLASIGRLFQELIFHGGTVESTSCRSEILVNSRPLYTSSNGIWESSPVTLNDLLIGHHFPPAAPEQDLEERVNPRQRMNTA